MKRPHYQLRHTIELLLEADDTLFLQMVYGDYLGASSRWPDFVAAKLLAMAETLVPSYHVGHHMVKFLDAVYRAHEKFHEAEIRAKVSLAKCSRPFTNRRIELVTGDTVFYFESLEKGKDSWHGPAVVIGAGGDFVVLPHGGRVRRVRLLHCRPASAVLGSLDVDPEFALVARLDGALMEPDGAAR